jgi:hypothetical protein
VKPSSSYRYAVYIVIAAILAVHLPSEGRFSLRTATAAPADQGKPSLPHVDDVVGQIRIYVERLDDALAKPDSYDVAKQARVEKDATTLAALAAMLARHDAQHDLKPAASAMRDAAAKMAANYREHEPCAAELKRIKDLLAGEAKAPSASSETSGPLAADAVMLMKHLRFIDNRLKREPRPRNPDAKARAEIAGHAATIAALAEPLSGGVKSYARAATREAAWQEQSTAMAVAAVRLNAAARDESGAKIAAAARALDATCNRCHADYR